MNTCISVPNTLLGAGRELRIAFGLEIDQLPKPDFLRAWCSVAYLFPGLHPDGYEDEGSGWPRALRRFAAEAWRRAEAGELSDDELYPCDPQWAGLYDRMLHHAEDETDRRFLLASEKGTSPGG
jgi:hypothetical protein